MLGTWVDVLGGRSFQLCDVPRDLDPKLNVKANYAWNDLMRIESVPVMEASEAVKLLSSLK